MMYFNASLSAPQQGYYAVMSEKSIDHAENSSMHSFMQGLEPRAIERHRAVLGTAQGQNVLVF